MTDAQCWWCVVVSVPAAGCAGDRQRHGEGIDVGIDAAGVSPGSFFALSPVIERLLNLFCLLFKCSHFKESGISQDFHPLSTSSSSRICSVACSFNIAL